RLGANPVPLTIPIGEGELFVGIIDLITMKARIFNESSMGTTFEDIDIPRGMEKAAKEARIRLLESVSSEDDTLLEKYLDGKEISPEEIKAVLRRACIKVTIIPVICGSAFKNKGVQNLLDAVIDFLPFPNDIPEVQGHHPHRHDHVIRKVADGEKFSSLAFKIMTDQYVGKLTFIRVYSGTLKSGSYVYNSNSGKKERIGRILRMHANHREDVDEIYTGDIAAVIGLKSTRTGDTLCDETDPIILEKMEFPEPVISVAIEPKTKADQDKLGEALSKLSDEDPTFRVSTDHETLQTIISGMGELHLEIIVDRMRREFGVQANVGKPQVAYRETIRKKVSHVYKHVKQSGGRGQFAHIEVEFEPNEMGKGYEFIDGIRGGVIPREFIPAVEEGIEQQMRNGILAGYPVVDVKARLFYGSYHDVDSDEMSFKIAGSMCFREAAKKASPVILEPIMSVEVVTPEEYVGDVLGDLNSRRGAIEGMSLRKDAQVVRAHVPLSEMFGYSTRLRSMTQGRAIYTMQLANYAETPKSVANEIIEKVTGATAVAA
ncbi:MAG: elongation factor G, partial [Ignavibacteriales bacterium]|nr:elongation factor G [Ignavibacteriales bacterium]